MRIRLFVLLALVALAALAAVASAHEENGTRTLAHNGTIVVDIDASHQVPVDVDYEVAVLSGPAVCVYFTNSQGYAEYNDPSRGTFLYYEEWSAVDTSSISMGFKVQDMDTYYLIIENSAPSGLNATVHYSVSYDAVPFPVAVFVSIFVVVIVVVVVGIFFVRRRQAQEAALAAGGAAASAAAPGAVAGGEYGYTAAPGDPGPATEVQDDDALEDDDADEGGWGRSPVTFGSRSHHRHRPAHRSSHGSHAGRGGARKSSPSRHHKRR